MTISRKLAAAGAATAIAALAAVTAPAARAATPQCGSGCVALYNLVYSNADVIGAVGSTFATLQPASSSNPAEDWFLSAQDTVNDFYLAGLMSAAVNQHYGNDEAYEYEYAPDGVASGYCLVLQPHAVTSGSAGVMRPAGAGLVASSPA